MRVLRIKLNVNHSEDLPTKPSSESIQGTHDIDETFFQFFQISTDEHQVLNTFNVNKVVSVFFLPNSIMSCFWSINFSASSIYQIAGLQLRLSPLISSKLIFFACFSLHLSFLYQLQYIPFCFDPLTMIHLTGLHLNYRLIHFRLKRSAFGRHSNCIFQSNLLIAMKTQWIRGEPKNVVYWVCTSQNQSSVVKRHVKIRWNMNDAIFRHI